MISIVFSLSVKAQVTQQCIAQEYNEKAQKTPLAGVEVRARYAGSAVSGKDGNFTLVFPNGSPGQHVDLRSIEKNGYEIFNREAIEQWNLNPGKPFVIVMCRSDKFKRIRDNYHKVSSESYARKLKQDEAALAKLKAEGKLRDAEYNQQLLDLRENYERQLDNLEAYIDRFARIDLSELSSTEQEIIELVQQGRIDEAIQRYDDLNIEDSLVDGINDLKKVDSAISQLSEKEAAISESSDSLYAMASRQIENLMMEATPDRVEKAKSIYCRLADSDTTNVEWLWKTGDFLSSTTVGDHQRALHYYYMALENSENLRGAEHADVAASCCKIAEAFARLGDERAALFNYKKALAIRERLYGSDHPDVIAIREAIVSTQHE